MLAVMFNMISIATLPATATFSGIGLLRLRVGELPAGVEPPELSRPWASSGSPTTVRGR